MSSLSSILIIDDNPTDVFIIKEFLSRISKDFELMVQNNGADALEYLRSEKSKQSEENHHFQHQLVLLDINMPKMNGFEFMDQFDLEFGKDSFFKDTVIVVCSSSQNETDLKNAFERDRINDFLVKPLTIKRLQEVIKEYF